LGLSGLDEAVNGLHEAVGDLGVEPPQDALPVTLDGFRGLDDRRQATVSGPEIPLFQVRLGVLSGWLIVEVLEGEADLVSSHGLQVGLGEIVKSIDLRV